MLFGTDITMYKILIGCDQWAITLGIYDVYYATDTLARSYENSHLDIWVFKIE